MTTPHPDVDGELRRLQGELERVRARTAHLAWGLDLTPDAGALRRLGRFAGTLVLTSVFGALAGFGVLAGAYAVFTGDLAVAFVFLFFGAVFAVPALVAARRYWRQIKPAADARDRLVAEERAIVARIGYLYSVRGSAPTSAEGLPLPPERQPSAYAQMMHARFPGRGASPEQALASLPADAQSWRVTFHRYAGWGVVGALLFTVSGLLARVFLGG